MKNRAFQVAIIGGGMGGLCLANGLKKAGISVAVYERDHSPDSRPQGYRIHIDPQGSTALHECLPQHLWDLFCSTGGSFSHGFSIVTQQLHELLSLGRTSGAGDNIAQHRSISRITLRRILRQRRTEGAQANQHPGGDAAEYRLRSLTHASYAPCRPGEKPQTGSAQGIAHCLRPAGFQLDRTGHDAFRRPYAVFMSAKR